MIIQHNISAMNANRMQNSNTNALAKTTEKLSSGYRINKAGDDASGLAISEKMRGQIRGLNKGYDNISDGVNICKIADGALSEISSMLHRLEELSVQAANDTLTDEDRNNCDMEMQQ